MATFAPDPRPKWNHAAPCLNCRAAQRGAGRRGLCRVCYNRPSVRARFPALVAGADARPALCVHCNTRKNSRPRNLCFACSNDPGTRSLYPTSDSYHALRGVPDPVRQPPHAPSPTTARPGTEAKMRVLAERAAAGFQLFHPLDPTDLEGVDPRDIPSLAAADASHAARAATRAGRKPGPSPKRAAQECA